jgi:hypothetical protein
LNKIVTIKITIVDPKNILSCKLTTPELHLRRKTIIAELKYMAVGKIETHNGYKYEFECGDVALDTLTAFIKSERLCCEFFVFKLTVSGKDQPVWLELSGPEGAREFIKDEIGL